jgi:LmbE family N-acetylglucosaminyl deacetylase/GT2 family glycosyltransferase
MSMQVAGEFNDDNQRPIGFESELIPYHAVQSLGKGRVLVLAPHPDDEVFGCAGAIMRHVAAGDPVTVIILTDGGGFYAAGPERDAYIAQRRQESRTAAAYLGYGEPVFWEYRDRELLYNETLVQRLCETVAKTSASWLYAPSPYELHPDHRHLSWAALAVARRTGRSLTLAFYEIGAPLPPNRLLDISDLLERKSQAIHCFVSQLSVQAYDRHVEALNYYRTYTLSREIEAAEGYWVIDGDTVTKNLPIQRPLVPTEQWPNLAISMVTYAPDLTVLAMVMDRLGQALAHAQHRNLLGAVQLTLVDNGPGASWRKPLQNLLEAAALPATVELLSGQGNVGYGAGHNLAFHRGGGAVHLILNPDVLLEEDALSEGLAFLAAHPEAGLVAPAAWDGEGQRQYLCKRYPTVLDLALRGFAPAKWQRWFQNRLDRYELREQADHIVLWDPPIASGCFMLCRRAALEQVGGFQPDYFLYFEDFDLSLRLASVARLAYASQVRIVHLGGHAARKGWRHIGLFIRAAARFFHRHGWRWW